MYTYKNHASLVSQKLGNGPNNLTFLFVSIQGGLKASKTAGRHSLNINLFQTNFKIIM